MKMVMVVVLPIRPNASSTLWSMQAILPPYAETRGGMLRQSQRSLFIAVKPPT